MRHRRPAATLAVAAIVATLFATAPARAEGDPAEVETGPYLGLGAVYAFENFSFDSNELGMTGFLGPGFDPKYDDSAGADLQLGWRMHPVFAVEFLYGWLEGFDSTRGALSTEIDWHLVTLNAKIFPFPGRIEPYAVAGLGVLIINTEVGSPAFPKPFQTDAGFASRFGAGVDFGITEHLVFELEGTYVVPAGRLVQHANAGELGFRFQYRF